MTCLLLTLSVVVIGVGGPANDKEPFFRTHDMRCGSYCLYVGLKALGLPVDGHEQLEATLGQPSPMGYSMAQLAEAARHHGATVVGVRTTLDEISRYRGRFVCIARLDKPGHFLMIRDVTPDMVDIVDPPDLRTCQREIFEQLWPGEALLISSGPLVLEPPAWHGWLAAAGIAAACLLGVALVVFLMRQSKRRLSVAAVAIGMWIGLQGCGVGPHSPGPPALPRAVVEPRRIDLGSVPASAETSRRLGIVLRNLGTAPLRLREVIATCGCTLVRIPKLVLEPGASETIAVAVKPGIDGGARQSLVTISSNDPSAPLIEVPVRWTTIAPITVTPAVLDFGTLRTDSLGSLDLQITLSQQVAGKLDVLCDAETFKYEWLEPPSISNSPRTARTGKLRITLTEAARLRSGGAVVIVRSNAEGREVSVPVSWKVVEELSASPPALFVSGVDAGGSVRQSVLVTSGVGQEFTVVRILIDGREFEFSRGNRQRRKYHALPLRLNVADRPGVQRGQIEITTDHAGPSKLVVPYTLVVK